MRYATHLLPILAATALLGGLTGCASLVGQDPNETAQETEPMLEAAGFQRLPADTPQKLAHLKTLTPLQLRRHRTKDGRSQYWWADPYYCQCLFVGDWQAYESLKRDQAEQDATRLSEGTATMDDDVEPDSELDPMMDPFGPFAF
jgi:hypothetical protein